MSSHSSTFPETIPVQDSTIKSKLLPDLVIRVPKKFTKDIIAAIVFLAIGLISIIVFSIQIQKLIDSDAELETKLTSMDHAFDNHDHDEKFDALEKKSGKTIFLIQQ